jgi:hypothetical protein
MKEVIIAILIIGFILISFGIASDEVEEKIKAESEEKKRQETEDNKLHKIADILNSLEPFMKSFKNISSHALIHYYDSRDISGANGIDDTYVVIHYTYKNYSNSFILYFSDMETMKREINNHFLDTVKDYDIYENKRFHLENVKSESLDIEINVAVEYSETITGKVIYRDGTDIKDIARFITENFAWITNFRFYEENINHNKFNIDGLKEREFEIERKVFKAD